MFAFFPAEEARSQTAEPIELPPVEVVVSPPKKKYPAVTVAKKSKPAARPVAAPAPVVPQPAQATESFEGLSLTIPGIAIVGDIIDPGPRGTWQLDGSGQVVGGEELYTSHVLNTAEALRKVTGSALSVSRRRAGPA